ncbi:MAG: hypothetical protein ACYC8T_16700 [Myxococcaceae bacterium]
MPVSGVSSGSAGAGQTNRIHYYLTKDEVAALPEQQRNAFKLLVGLAKRQNVAGIAELKQWAGVSNPDGLAKGHEAIGRHTVEAVAKAFAAAGHPLTTEHVNAFKANRKMSGGSELGPDTAKALLDTVRGAMKPPDDYTRVSFRGVTLNRRTVSMLEQAEAISRSLGGPSRFGLTQGSYHAGVGKSGHTHDAGGVIDISVYDRGPAERAAMVTALRRAGFAAWSRGPADGMSPHIHAVAIGDRQMTWQAHHQVDEYFGGGDGLVGDRADGNRDLGRPIPDWARRSG